MPAPESAAPARTGAPPARAGREAGALAADVTYRPRATLLVRSGAARGERFATRPTVTTLGSADFNDVVVREPGVSPAHAAIHLRESVWVVADLGSGSGTWVDGERVEGEVPLAPGSVIRVGGAELLFNPWEAARVVARDAEPSLLVPPEPPLEPGRLAAEERRQLREWLLKGIIIVGAFVIGFLLMTYR